MPKFQNIQQSLLALAESLAKVRQKLLNWTAASVVATDPLTDDEKQQLLQQAEDKQ